MQAKHVTTSTGVSTGKEDRDSLRCWGITGGWHQAAADERERKHWASLLLLRLEKYNLPLLIHTWHKGEWRKMQVCCFFFFLIVGLCGLTVIIQTALLRLEFHGTLLEKKNKVQWNGTMSKGIQWCTNQQGLYFFHFLILVLVWREVFYIASFICHFSLLCLD